MSLGLLRLLDDPAPPPKVFSARLEAAPGRIGGPSGELVEVAPPGGALVLHPRYGRFLARCGLTTAQAIYDLPGDVVSGHPDRHVVRVVLRTGTCERTVYLKREHVVGLRAKWKNRRAGFGRVTRSEREAMVLKRLEALHLSAPQWLAYGVDRRGRGFLLVDELPTAQEIGSIYGNLDEAQRHRLAQHIGRTIAAYHASGIATPDLCWKHLFVEPNSLTVSMIDWQSATLAVPSSEAVLRSWASLNASLPNAVADRLRLRAFVDYRRELTRRGSNIRVRLRDLLSLLPTLKSRSRLQEQREGGRGPIWRWLAGEAACVIPEIAEAWPTPADGPPFYGTNGTDEIVTLTNGLRCRIERFRSFDPVGRLVAAVREKPWRSPAALACRVLVHLARYDIAAPRVLAFGQKTWSPVHAESFLLTDTTERTEVAAVALTRLSGAKRRELLTAIGAFVSRIHACGAAAASSGGRAFGLEADVRLRIESSSAWQLRKRMSRKEAVLNLAELTTTELPGLSRRDRLVVIRGYLGSTATRDELRRCFRWIERRNGRLWSL